MKIAATSTCRSVSFSVASDKQEDTVCIHIFQRRTALHAIENETHTTNLQEREQT